MKPTHYNEHGHPIPDGMTREEWRAHLDSLTLQAYGFMRDDALARGDREEAMRIEIEDMAPLTVPLRVIPLPAPDPDISGFIATALAVNEPVTFAQRIHRLISPFRRRKLKRITREWLPAACKGGPRSVEWEFVAEWSWELRSHFGE